ncbi:uncharacterized protein LOC114936461 isoform X2 [Nylanderia fulva]|uniref:uncharacterized protein LOC114936461 isoform X2 n=1 Tax=Nylanderia fulva TaxID=613905 RepID=UPI0010FB835C|nr:uncharacterized protein LOC114936461 isoform X2 [Nylanderia fulva]
MATTVHRLDADATGLQRAVVQQQKYQKSSKSHKIMSPWSIICAIELGFVQQSSLKDVTIVSYWDLDFLRTAKRKSSDQETNNHEDVVSTNIFGNTWPFIDPAQITKIVSRKSIRKRSKRRSRWSTRRQRKRNVDRDINDDAKSTTNLPIKRESRRESDDSTGLSGNNFSLTQLRRDENRERLSESYGSTDEDEEATSETNSNEIARIDYSGAGYSRFYTPTCQKKELQNQAELPEYPDYFSNVLRIDDDNNTEDDDWFPDTQMKFHKNVSREINTRRSVKNGNTLSSDIVGKRSSRRKKSHRLSSEYHFETVKKRKNKWSRRKKKAGKSVMNGAYSLSRISRDSKENSPECKSDAGDGFAVDTRDTAKIVRERCDCNARRHSYNFTNAVCACKRNLKSTATAIMQDIQAYIRSAEIAKDAENVRNFATSDSLDLDKDLARRDISMEYDWIVEDNGEISSQESKRSYDLTGSMNNVSANLRRRKRRRLTRFKIDYKLVDRTETAYRSAFHECVNFDFPASSPLKINMDESWRSERSNSDLEMIHSSWRQSVSFTEECDNECDSALLLARKIVSDDLAKVEKYYDDERDILDATCYKYREISYAQEYTMRIDTSHDSCSDDEKFQADRQEETKSTYKKKGRNNRRSRDKYREIRYAHEYTMRIDTSAHDSNDESMGTYKKKGKNNRSRDNREIRYAHEYTMIDTSPHDSDDESMGTYKKKGRNNRSRDNREIRYAHKYTMIDTSPHHSDDETFQADQQEDTKSMVTYKKKGRNNRFSMNHGFFKNANKVRVTRHEGANSKIRLMRTSPDNKGTDLEYDSDKKKYVPRRITRALVKTTKENLAGKLVWGYCSGWWPALIVDAEHVGMAPTSGKLWVYWIGESQISLLKENTQIQPFSTNLEHRLTQPPRKNTRTRAIDATIQMLRQRFDCTLTKPYYYWIRRNITGFESLDDLIFYPYPKNVQERVDVLKEKNAKATEKFISNQKNSPETSSTKKQVVEKNKDMNTSWKQIDDERLPLQNQNPGVIAWAKIAGHCWWPAMIIDYRDCCLKEPSFGCQWIMWYGDYKVSEVRHLEFLKFYKGLEKMRDHIQNTVKQTYLEGVLQASKDYCSRLGCTTDNWTLDNVFEYFSNVNNIHIPYNESQVSDSNKIYDKYSDEIVKKINEFKSKPDIDDERKKDIKTSDALRRVISGECKIEKLCLKCLRFPKDRMEEHPFFIGSLCKECSYTFKPCMFVHGNDGKCFYCTVCASTGTVLMCDSEDCPRVYCTACSKFLICPNSYEKMLLEDPWKCFLCRDESKQLDMFLNPRLDWKDKFSTMFRTASNLESDDVNLASYKKQKKPIRVLSLFDGLSTGFLVLLNLGIVVDVYYASEIDNDALTISSAHFGDRITYLGDVRGITKEKIQEIAPIDLLIGGSPCNDLSLVNPARLGLHDPRGTGILFFEYCRIKKLMTKANKNCHLFWLFENVASMPSEYRLEINKHLKQEPDVIDSADFSPQHRLRLYWHNLPFNPYMPLFQNRQDVQDKLTPNLNRKALCKKLRTVTCRTGSLLQGKAEVKPILMKGASDRIWITELEEIFGFPRHYTDVKNLSATNRQKLLGKSWSVQTLTAILRPLCSYFKCNEDKTSNNSSALYEDILTPYRGKHF